MLLTVSDSNWYLANKTIKEKIFAIKREVEEQADRCMI